MESHNPSNQEVAHGEGHDYFLGSPHLRHFRLREKVATSLREAISSVLIRQGECRVLEVGAGHGEFTDVIAGMGASVTVTEMSRPSANLLARRYDGNNGVDVIEDIDGDWLFSVDREFDVIACISVLHHIPDYERFIRRAIESTATGGAFVSWQDPLWYPRRSRANLAMDRGAYFAWRLGQGDLARGLRTRLRRLRGIYDESYPSELSEYHVVRQGVDEERIAEILAEAFGEVRVTPYWSTQSTLGQRIGSKLGIYTTFGVEGLDRI